jgi:UDP-glucose 4-epimerase
VILKGYSAAYGLETICQRYFNVYGPRQDPASHYAGVIAKFKDRLSKGEPVTIFGDGLQTRDFVHVTDVAAANVLAALRNEARSGSYNICTGRGTSLLDLLGYLDPEARSGGRVRYAEGKPGDIRESVGHPEAAEAELGFRAQVTVADALRGQAHPVLPLKPAPLDTLRIPAGV